LIPNRVLHHASASGTNLRSKPLARNRASVSLELYFSSTKFPEQLTAGAHARLSYAKDCLMETSVGKLLCGPGRINLQTRENLHWSPRPVYRNVTSLDRDKKGVLHDGMKVEKNYLLCAASFSYNLPSYILSIGCGPAPALPKAQISFTPFAFPRPISLANSPEVDGNA
jgi:hypothetical protein